MNSWPPPSLHICHSFLWVRTNDFDSNPSLLFARCHSFYRFFLELVPYGLVWNVCPCMVLYGTKWSCMVQSSLVWSCMVLYGLVWSYAAMHNFCACFNFKVFTQNWKFVIHSISSIKKTLIIFSISHLVHINWFIIWKLWMNRWNMHLMW